MTPEAQFANALDRLQPLILNAHSSGGSWLDQALTRDDVLKRMAPVAQGLPGLWPTVERVVEAFGARKRRALEVRREGRLKVRGEGRSRYGVRRLKYGAKTLKDGGRRLR